VVSDQKLVVSLTRVSRSPLRSRTFLVMHPDRLTSPASKTTAMIRYWVVILSKRPSGFMIHLLVYRTVEQGPYHEAMEADIFAGDRKL
jgi:hypothetical protein